MSKRSTLKENLLRINYLLLSLNLAEDFKIQLENPIENIIPFTLIESVVQYIDNKTVASLYEDGQAIAVELVDDGSIFTFVDDDEKVVQRRITDREIDINLETFEAVDCWADKEEDCTWSRRIYPETGELQCRG